MAKGSFWPENDNTFKDGGQILTRKAGRENLFFFNLNEQTFHKFMMTLPVSDKQSNIIICSPRLCALSLFLLSEFASVHAVFMSDCAIDRVAEGIRRMPLGGKVALTLQGIRSLTLTEFRVLYLLIQGISMNDIAIILGFSLSTIYVYRTTLSEKMQFPHSVIPTYAL